MTQSRNDIKICLDFTDASSLLIENFGEDGSVFSPYYNGTILYNYQEPNYINLIIYYTLSERLFEKFQKLKEEGINILQGISTTSAQQTWELPETLDFSKSNLRYLEQSPYWEHNKIPLTLIIDNLELLIPDIYSSSVDGGNFKLTENVYQHIREYISYGGLGSYNSSDRLITTDNNRVVQFGEIQLILSFVHSYGIPTKFSFVINRDAYLEIIDGSGNLTDLQIIEYANILCTLMSFYWHKIIDYFVASVRVNNIPKYQTREVYKYSNHYVDESSEFFLRTYYPTVYDFFESLNPTKVFKHKSLLDEIVPRIIRIKSVDDISEFMLLYNIIEKIRNYCIKNPIGETKLEIKEEFKFTKGKATTNDFIKNKIKEIVEIVADEDKNSFENIASDKVSFIKNTKLIDQFNSFFIYLNLNLSSYNLDFEKSNKN